MNKMIFRITTTSTGYFRPNLHGTAYFNRMITVYLGDNLTRTEIPTYCVCIDGSSQVRENCQAGRDFTFDEEATHVPECIIEND